MMELTTIRRITLSFALVAGLAAASLLLSHPSSGQTGLSVSADAMPDASNTASSVGTIDTCRAFSPGATFAADVVIQGVTGIAGMEGHLLYNSSVLRVTAVNYSFLIGSAGGSRVELGDLVPDMDGDFEMGVVTFPLAPVSGSGVLARVTFEAASSGTSPLDLQSLKLSDGLGSPIPPADSVTGIFTGTVNDASAASTAWSTPIGDDDCDAFPSSAYDQVTKRAAESFMGTAPLARCAATATLNDEDPDAWPVDNNDDRSANLADVLAYIPAFGATGPSPPYSPRFDLNQDNGIGLSDILMFIPFFGVTCTP